MPEPIRSFLAFDIENDTVLNRLADAQHQLLQTGADVKLVEPQNIHITIRFLGNITLETFNVQIKGLGAFPNPRYPRVVWAGITQGAEQLQSVFSQLEPKLRGLGFTPDTRGFSPHLTIARVRSSRNKQQLAEFLTKNANYEIGPVDARCLRLKKSALTPRGPIYSTLKEFCPP